MILLASRSPQRAWLLQRAGIAFRIVASACDEEAITAPTPAALAAARARGKAAGAAAADGVLLGADTVVALGSTVYGSPADDAEARATLAALSGTTHAVLTAHCLLHRVGGTVVAQAEATAAARVTMRALTSAEIAAYVASGESRGRAGAYALQERGDRFVTAIAGDWDTIVGLHVASVVALHRQLLGTPPPRA